MLTSIRQLRPRDAIRYAKQIAAADWTALLLVMVTQTVLIVTVKLFDARYTDLLPPFVAIIAGVQGSRLASRVGSKHWVSGALAILVSYQLVYAAGVLRRYTSDSRIAMNHSVRNLVPVGARIAISPYVPVTEAMARYTLIPQGLQASAEWVVAMDLHAERYLTHSGSFLALGMPADCSAVYNCEGKAALSFYQDLYTGRAYELVHHAKAPVWTPEMWLWRQLMGSRWMFTSDARLFRKMR